MLRKFSIEWPDHLGPLWMNTDDLLTCITETCRNTRFNVTDITNDGECDGLPRASGPRNTACCKV